MTNKHMKWCSVPLVISGKKFKTIMSYHFTGTKIAIIRKKSNDKLECGETGTFIIAGGKVNWCSGFGK